jgi:hypothetical protein
MGTLVGVGYSVHRNPLVAGKEAAVKALQQAGISEPDFVLVFATVGYDQQLLIGAIREATSRAPLSGCSGEGVIIRNHADETNFGVSVMVIRSDEMEFANVRIKDIADQADLGGRSLAEAIKSNLRSDSKGIFLLVDGLVFNFDPFLSAFESALDMKQPLPILGGLAADNWQSHRTFQYHNDEVFSEGISCILLSGTTELAWAVNHGCVPIGKKRTITRSQGNVIYEIDGVSALDVLREFVDEESVEQWNKTSLNLCLGFKTPEHLLTEYEQYIIRYLIGKNDADGSVSIQSEVKNGDELWIVRRDKELITNGLQQVSARIKEQMGGRVPKFVLQFECVGRGKVVFREREKIELIQMLHRQLGHEVPCLGFYSYGELGPVGGFNCFHNFSSVIAAVY